MFKSLQESPTSASSGLMHFFCWSPTRRDEVFLCRAEFRHENMYRFGGPLPNFGNRRFPCQQRARGARGAGGGGGGDECQGSSPPGILPVLERPAYWCPEVLKPPLPPPPPLPPRMLCPPHHKKPNPLPGEVHKSSTLWIATGTIRSRGTFRLSARFRVMLICDVKATSISCHNVMHALSCRDHVTQEDLEAFLSPDKARAALDSLDLDKDGHISLQDMRDAVLQARVTKSLSEQYRCYLQVKVILASEICN